MKDKKKTKDQLINELVELRQRIAGLEASEAERKPAEEDLRESNARYKAFFDRTLYCVYVHNLEGRFIDANDAALNLLCYKREDIPSVKFSTLLEEDQLPIAFKNMEELLQTGSQKRPIEYKLRKKDGGYVWVEAEASVIYRKGKPYAIQGIARDITERIQAEEALRESEQRFRTMFESASDGILVTDVETKKFYLGNKTICRMLNYSQEEIKNLTVMDIHPEEDLPHVFNEFEKLARKEITLTENIPLKRKDGRVFYVDINTSWLTSAGKTYIAGFFK